MNLDNKTTVENLGFKFLNLKNDEKVLTNYKYDLLCPKGHVFNTRLDNILFRSKERESKGCLVCHRLELETESMEATKKNLPSDYIIIDTFLKEKERKGRKSQRFFTILCNKGHTYIQEAGKFKSINYCSECMGNINLGEERSRNILESLLGEKFIKIRPNFLKNPETGSNLELDGYSEKLKMAFEFQGNQHYQNNTQFGSDLDGIQKRDALKKDLLKKEGIFLIELKQPISYEEKKFKDDIFKQIMIIFKDKPDILLKIENGIQNKKNDLNINSQKIIDNSKYGNLFKDWVNESSPIKGYSVLTDNVLSHDQSISMQCPNGHAFSTTAYEFKNNSKGVKGRSIPCKLCYELEFGEKRKIDLSYAQEKGKEFGLTLLDDNYQNMHQDMKWKDDKNNIIHLNLHSLERRVPEDEKERFTNNQYGVITIDTCRDLGQKFGLELISDTYINVNAPMIWKDKDGNLIEKNLRKLQRSKTDDEKSRVNKHLDLLKKLGYENGLELISSNYTGALTEVLEWKDSNGNIVLKSIGEIRGIDAKNSQPAGLETARELGKVHNLELISTKYTNINADLEWKDSDGNILQLSLRKIQRNKTGNFKKK